MNVAGGYSFVFAGQLKPSLLQFLNLTGGFNAARQCPDLLDPLIH